MDNLTGLALNLALSIGGAALSAVLIPDFKPIFIKRKMFGRDLCKKSGVEVAEPMGVITATVYLVIMFAFIPIPFYGWIQGGPQNFPYQYFVEFLSGLISICCMIFLGFADDVLDLRWRHKLMFPTLASLPMLMVYFANSNSTTILLPRQLAPFLGYQLSVDISLLYYIYMGMLAVFCTNAINILAGVNGLEAGQSLVIAISVVLYNFIQLLRGGGMMWNHLFSLYFLLPYIGTTLVLFCYNWYPATVFVGDTFCYFSGMTFAVVGILGHFSKTLLLFFMPQIFNFLFSIPQLFKLIHCPRHRLPKFNPDKDILEFSVTTFKKSSVGFPGRIFLFLFRLLRLIDLKEFEKDGETWQECNNFTLICLVLKWCGPLHEQSLVTILLVIQIASSVLAFVIRFGMSRLVYDVVH